MQDDSYTAAIRPKGLCAGYMQGPLPPEMELTCVLVLPGPSNPASTSLNLEFAETATVTLEWRLTGLKNVYDTTKGDTKS